LTWAWRPILLVDTYRGAETAALPTCLEYLPMLARLFALGALFLGGAAAPIASTPASPPSSLLGTAWRFDGGRLDAWRHKENARLSVDRENGNPAFRLQSKFEKAAYTWTTCQFPLHTAADVRHVTFRLRGDASGHTLIVNLGCTPPGVGRQFYYRNAKTLTLDFQGWRQVSLNVEDFQTPSGGLRERDLAAVAFLQFFVEAQGPKPLDLRIDDIQFTGPTAEEQAAAEQRRRRRAELIAQSQPRLAAVRGKLSQLESQLKEAGAAGKFVDVARVYLAALEWCAGDAERTLQAEEFEIVTQAPAFLADLEQRLATPDVVLGRIQDRTPVEPDTLDAAHNPYFAQLVKDATPLSRREQVWAKGRAGFRAVPNAWTFASLGHNTYRAAWTMLRPRSPLRHNPMLLRNALGLFDVIAHQHTDGDFNIDRTAIYGSDGNINRFCLCPALDAWWELSQAYPDLLPQAKRADLEQGLRRLVDFQVHDYGTPRLARNAYEKHPAYPNMDVHHILIMELAHRVWKDPQYARECDAFVRILDGATYPMGAWAYINTQNECFVYHHLNVLLSARYWQLSRNPVTLAMLRRTIAFYPYNVEPAGMPEYYTDACWKHYWSGGGAAGPDAIAGLFNDPLNKQVAETAAAVWGYGGGHEGAIAAEFWKPMAAKPLPDGYVMYDTNIDGPRGRYGTWSFGGNGRNYGVGYQGKDTFVGAMITDPPRRPMPLDSALQVVTAEVRLTRDGNHWTGARCCSALEKLTTALGPDFGSLAVRYTVSKPNWHHKSDDLLPWDGTQQWYLSRTRLVGLVALEAMADENRAGVYGRVRLGLSRNIETLAPRQWRYGRMQVTIHDHNYARVETRPSETFFLDKPEAYKSTEITLLDPLSTAAGAKPSVRYAKGTRYWFLVEVRPDTSSPAERVERIERGGLFGFRFQEGGRSVLVLHNPGEQAATADVPAGTLYDRHEPQGQRVPAGRIEIGPARHVTLVSGR
jgi:hypothetical protein